MDIWKRILAVGGVLVVVLALAACQRGGALTGSGGASEVRPSPTPPVGSGSPPASGSASEVRPSPTAPVDSGSPPASASTATPAGKDAGPSSSPAAGAAIAIDPRIRWFARDFVDAFGAPAITNSLGAPLSEALNVQMAYQPFEGWQGDGCQSETSEMLWRADRREIYFLPDAVFGDLPAACRAIWQRFDDTWEEGDPSNPDIPSPSEQRLTPIRGFGKVWREHLFQREPGLGDGYATARELGFTGVIQEFENGRVILWPERSKAWVLYDVYSFTDAAGTRYTHPVWFGIN